MFSLGELAVAVNGAGDAIRLSIQDKNAEVSPEKVSESGRTIRSAVDEQVALRGAEPMTAEILRGELEAHWDWATGDIDNPLTRPKRVGPSPHTVTEH